MKTLNTIQYAALGVCSNKVLKNEFGETYISATSRGYTNTVFANYWAGYDEPGEGCADAIVCRLRQQCPGHENRVPAGPLSANLI